MPEKKKELPARSKTKAPSPTSPVGGRGYTGIYFSHKKPDWDYWKKFDLWTLGQAVCLICECDPAELESGSHPLSPHLNSRVYDDSKSKELRRLYDLAVNSLESGTLRPADQWEQKFRQDLQKKIKPSQFIAWADNKGISVPDEIKDFKEQEGPPSDSELLIDPDHWMAYDELKNRWGNKSDHEFVLLMTKIGLTAFKGNFPPLSCKPEAAELKDYYFIRFHVDHLEREHPELIDDKKVDEGAAENFVRTAAQRIKEVGFKSRDEVANDTVIKQICKEQNIKFEPTLRKKLDKLGVLPKGKPWSQMKAKNRS